jgi:hypothetical protein
VPGRQAAAVAETDRVAREETMAVAERRAAAAAADAFAQAQARLERRERLRQVRAAAAAEEEAAERARKRAAAEARRARLGAKKRAQEMEKRRLHEERHGQVVGLKAEAAAQRRQHAEKEAARRWEVQEQKSMDLHRRAAKHQALQVPFAQLHAAGEAVTTDMELKRVPRGRRHRFTGCSGSARHARIYRFADQRRLLVAPELWPVHSCAGGRLASGGMPRSRRRSGNRCSGRPSARSSAAPTHHHRNHRHSTDAAHAASPSLARSLVIDRVNKGDS